jgi:hypothetical protein
MTIQPLDLISNAQAQKLSKTDLVLIKDDMRDLLSSVIDSMLAPDGELDK